MIETIQEKLKNNIPLDQDETNQLDTILSNYMDLKKASTKMYEAFQEMDDTGKRMMAIIDLETCLEKIDGKYHE